MNVQYVMGEGGGTGPHWMRVQLSRPNRAVTLTDGKNAPGWSHCQPAVREAGQPAWPAAITCLTHSAAVPQCLSQCLYYPPARRPSTTLDPSLTVSVD